ncbi:MAG: mitochondrial membrane protein, partial [Paramarteilia canceri]
LFGPLFQRMTIIDANRSQITEENLRDVYYYMAFIQTKLKNYVKAVDIIETNLANHQNNQQIADIKAYASKKVNQNALIGGAAIAGGILAGLIGAVAIFGGMSRKR